jgi:chaperonin GroEL
MVNFKNNNLIEGFFTVCDAVGVTIGKNGGLGLIDTGELGAPNATKDGITIARNIHFFEDRTATIKEQAIQKEKALGANMAKTASAVTLLKVGDNTTTTLVIAKALVAATKKRKNIFSKSEYYLNPKVKLGIDEAYDDICRSLAKLSETCTEKTLGNIATTSANNDATIGAMIMEAYKAIGGNGIVDVREGDFTELVITNGMKLEKGFVSPFLINNQKKATFESNAATVIVYIGFEIDKCKQVIDYINANKNKAIIIIAERLPNEDFINKLARINAIENFNVTAVECPYFDTQRESLLHDIALYTGAEVFVQGVSDNLVVGTVEKATIDFETTSLVGGGGNSAKIKERVEELKSQGKKLKAKESEFNQKRIQRLEGTSATIVVGGSNGIESNEVKDRFDDAIAAVKSAMLEGYIVGGGAGLVYIAKNLNQTFHNKDVQFGYNCLKTAIKEPFKQICKNSKRNYKDYITIASQNYGMGYNANTDEISNLLEDKIVDSKKSIRIAIEQAKTVVKLLLDTKVIITNN